MLGFAEKEVGHFTLRKWSLLYNHFKTYHNFCTKQGLFKEENGMSQNTDEWLPN